MAGKATAVHSGAELRDRVAELGKAGGSAEERVPATTNSPRGPDRVSPVNLLKITRLVR